MRTSHALRASLLLTTLGAALGASAQARYSVRALDPHISDSSSGMNARGEVTGSYNNYDVDGTTQAFRETNGNVQLLGTLGGSVSLGFGINDVGQVVGNSYLADDVYENRHAFLSTGGSMQDLGTLGGHSSDAWALNAVGQVTGTSTTTTADDSPNHAFLYSNGTMKDIDSFGSSFSTGNGINSAGVVAGYYVVGGSYRAFRYTDATGMVDLGTLGGTYADAYAINDRGEIVGRSRDASGRGRAYVYADGKMTALASSATFRPYSAYGINNAGQIIGQGAPSSGSFFGHAYVYSAATGTQDLNDLIDLTGTDYEGYTLYRPDAINDAGQILVGAVGPSGYDYASFILTPQAVPEPAPCAALCLSSLVLLRGRKRG